MTNEMIDDAKAALAEVNRVIAGVGAVEAKAKSVWASHEVWVMFLIGFVVGAVSIHLIDLAKHL